jgi:hypothetical protein
VSTLAAYGISLELPSAWDGYAFRHEGGEPTVHVASFRLPHSDGEFGSRATAAMPSDGLFLALTEYSVDGVRVDHGIFAGQPPRTLRGDQLSPHTLLRPVAGQRGTQRFFSSSDRAFCLYVVVGHDGGRWLEAVNAVLSSIEIQSHA